jgi:2-aminoethylphosphonate dioxygenase
VSDLSPAFGALRDDPRLRDAAAEAAGRPVVVLKDKLILKPPGADGYALHQDAAYFPAPRPQIDGVIAMVALDPSDAANGGLALVPGAHDALHSPPGVPTDCDPSTLAPPEVLALDPGDVVLFSVLTPHGSAANASQSWRRHFFVTFVADDGTDQRTAYYDAQHRRLRDQLPPDRRARAVFR